MRSFHRLTPTFWRHDFSVRTSALGGITPPAAERGSSPIEVEDINPTDAAEDAACPTCDLPVDTDAYPCHFCRRTFDSEVCLETHSRMFHQAPQPIDDDAPPKPLLAFYVGALPEPESSKKPPGTLN